MRTRIPLILFIIALGLFTACSTQPPEAVDAPEVQATECPEAEPCPDCPVCPEPEEGAAVEVPFQEAWAGSGHADDTAEAFNHWNEDDPAEIPTTCARCHSTPGYRDYLGVDGSEFGVVDAAAPIGTVISCEACHNDVTASLSSVTFPSGVEITGLGPSARCMVCHQGRASKLDVDAAIEEVGLTGDEDTASEELGFINIHYYAAAASLFGSETHAGYEYEGNEYQIRTSHVENYNECIECHNQHTLELRIEECAACHEGVTSPEDMQNVRMNGSLADYDGDGDREEGVYHEIAGLREMLYTAMQSYAAEVVGTPLLYDEASYPYFFADANENNALDEGEERYSAFTPRLLKAAYNYQVSLKDPGAFAHNPKYHVALLYDSIASLNEALGEPVDLSTAHRNDPGHFDGTAEAFRHWDEDGAVPSPCSRCHSADGLPLFISEGAVIAQEPANGFKCVTCHESLGGEWPRRQAADATFPSGATLTFGEGEGSNLCIQCHQGRAFSGSVDNAVEGIADDTVTEGLRFINIHYFAAGATLFGSEAQGAYQYAGNEYAGRNMHVEAADTCNECHNVHALEVNQELCQNCHGDVHHHEIRMTDTDYDGDGDVEEGIGQEVEGLMEALYAAIQAYAADQVGTPIVYESHSYPYFFVDSNGNGEADPDEANNDNRYQSWTPRLLRAAYNYQYAQKDPGAFAHNGTYVIQVLYDSIQDVGGDVSAMTRP